MVHRSLLVGAGIVMYYALAGYGLYLFDAGLLVTQLWLFALPALVLARLTMAPSAVLVSVGVFGLGLGVLLEGIAHIYGLWYTLGVTELRLFGALPFEALVALLAQSLFLVLLYEALFDDASYTVRSARERLAAFAVFAVGAIGLIALHAIVVQGWPLSYSYLWLIGIFVAAAFAALSVQKNVTVTLVDKLIDFSLVAALPLALSLWLAVVNVHKVFAHTNEYIGTLNLFGAVVPLEEIILLFALPLLLAVVYEVYLDDQT